MFEDDGTNEDLFASLDIADALDDPFSVKDGTYEGVISNVEIRTGDKRREDGSSYTWKSMVVTFTSKNASDNAYEHWYGIPGPSDSDKAKSYKRSALKSLLSGLEIPESRMNSVKPPELIATPCAWTVTTNKKNPQYKNIKVYVPKGSPVSRSADSDQLMADIESLSGSNHTGL